MLQATDRAADELRLHRQGQHLQARGTGRAARARARSASSFTRTGAPRRQRSIAASTSPSSTTCRSRFTPTRSTSRASSTTRSPHSRAARFTLITPKAPAAGTRPTSSRSAAVPNVLPSSTNPTRPFTVNTLDEHLDMLMVCHHLDSEAARGRGLRREPHSRRDHRRRGHPPRPRRDQHDVERQPGHGPHRRGHHPHLADRAQDEVAARHARRRRRAGRQLRIKRYIAKYTINPAIAHGVAQRDRLASRWASSRTSCSGTRRSSAPSRSWCSRAASSPGRRWATPNASIPTPAAGSDAADVRRASGSRRPRPRWRSSPMRRRRRMSARAMDCRSPRSR